jgi:hypothetical protein
VAPRSCPRRGRPRWVRCVASDDQSTSDLAGATRATTEPHVGERRGEPHVWWAGRSRQPVWTLRPVRRRRPARSSTHCGRRSRSSLTSFRDPRTGPGDSRAAIAPVRSSSRRRMRWDLLVGSRSKRRWMRLNLRDGVVRAVRELPPETSPRARQPQHSERLKPGGDGSEPHSTQVPCRTTPSLRPAGRSAHSWWVGTAPATVRPTRTVMHDSGPHGTPNGSR